MVDGRASDVRAVILILTLKKWLEQKSDRVSVFVYFFEYLNPPWESWVQNVFLVKIHENVKMQEMSTERPVDIVICSGSVYVWSDIMYIMQ